MNIQTLAFTDGHGRSQAMHACGQCGTWFNGVYQNARTEAEECCTDIVHRCADCGVSLGRRVFGFPLCGKHERRRRILGCLERAEVVQPTAKMYAGPDGDGFFLSIEDRIADGDDLYCHPCGGLVFSLDVDDILDAATEEHGEDARDDLEDVDGLRAFLEAWAAKQDVVSYYPIMWQVVILDPEIKTRGALIEAVKARWALEDEKEGGE